VTNGLWRHALTEPPQSGFIKPVATMVPCAPRTKICSERSNPEHRLNAVFEHGHSIVVLYLDDSDHVEHTASR
jgi:hypothetical protein